MTTTIATAAPRKDKKKVLGEDWSDERVAAFLTATPADETDPDFYVLDRAYISMREQDFERFIQMFVAAGRNLNARNQNGDTLLTLADQHANSGEFVEILLRAGAIREKAPGEHPAPGSAAPDVDMED